MAQTELVQATPPPGAVLGTAPARIDLLFDGELDGEKSRVRLYDGAGARVDRRDLQVAGTSMHVGVRLLPPGAYTVRWVAAEVDDGPVRRGQYQFRVGRPAPGQPQLSISPQRSDAGQLMTVSGSGFTPNSVALVGIGDEQRFLGTAGVDGQGRFAVQALVPEYLPHGRQVVQALDLEQRMATAVLRVERGGWPPVAVQVSVGEEEQAGQVPVEVMLVNRSGYDLFDVSVSAAIPAGTRLIRTEVEGPEGLRWSADGGQLRWRNGRVRPHQYVGPFVYVLDVSGLPPGSPSPEPSVLVTFEHREAPQFRGQATAP
jgi:methionine-rich copper-binding protein CopC